jgi:hypothetical protein
MGVDHRITTTIESFKGLEKRRSDLIDKPGYFNDLKNAAIRASGAINKRKGFHTVVSHKPAPGENLVENDLGIASYTPSNELLVMNKNLKKVSEETLTITNNSNTDDVIASFLPNEDNKLEYKFRSRSTGVTVDIGTGAEDAANPGTVITTEENTNSAIPAKDKVFNYFMSNTADRYTQYWSTSDNAFGSSDFSEGLTLTYSGSNIFSKYRDTNNTITLFRFSTSTGDIIISYRRDSDYTNGAFTIVTSETSVSQSSNVIDISTISQDLIDPNVFSNHVNTDNVDYSEDIYVKLMLSFSRTKASISLVSSKATKKYGVAEIIFDNEIPLTELDFSAGVFSDISLLRQSSDSEVTRRLSLEAMSLTKGFKEIPSIIPLHNSSEGEVEGTLVGQDIFPLNPDATFYFGNGSHDSINVDNPQSRTVNVYSHGDNQNVSLSFITVGNYGGPSVTTYPDQMNLFTQEQDFYDTLYTSRNYYYNNSAYSTPIEAAMACRADSDWTISVWVKCASIGNEFTFMMDQYNNPIGTGHNWGMRTYFDTNRLGWALDPVGSDVDLQGVNRWSPLTYSYLNAEGIAALSNTDDFIHILISNDYQSGTLGGSVSFDRHVTTIRAFDKYGNNILTDGHGSVTRNINFSKVGTLFEANSSNFSTMGGPIDKFTFVAKHVTNPLLFTSSFEGLQVPADLKTYPVDGQVAHFEFGDNYQDGQGFTYSTSLDVSSVIIGDAQSGISVTPPDIVIGDEEDYEDDFIEGLPEKDQYKYRFPQVLPKRDNTLPPYNTLDTSSNIFLESGELVVNTTTDIGASNYFNEETLATTVISDTQNITSPYMLASVVNTINNFTHVDLTAVASDINAGTTTPSAFVIPIDETIIPQGESIELRYFVESTITKGDTSYNYFDNLHTKFVDQSDDFQNVSHTILNNSMYFATGFDEICKYDGNKIYRAGLPTPVDITASVANNTDTSSLNIGIDEDNDATTNSYYMITYKHEDANGNVIQSTQSATAKVTGNTGHNQGHRHLIEVTIPTVQPGSGFNLDDITALIWRAPNTTTEEVLAASSFYQVTTGSKTSPALTHAEWSPLGLTASNYVNVAVDQVDPNDVNTWTYTLNNNIVSNDKSVASVKYLDFLTDADINLNEFITTSDYAEGRHDLPPKCAFITNHQGCLILAGTAENPNELFYSLPEFNFITGEIGSEYFPNNANSVIMHGANGTNITAVKTLRETLMVFNKNSVSVLSGDITTTGVQYLKKDSLTAQGEQGTISSNCLQEWEGTLTFLSQDGILSTNTNLSYPTEMSESIKPLLLDKKFDRKRAVSFFSADQDVMGFYLPVQDEIHMGEVGAEGIFNNYTDSKLLIYDVNIGGWLEWSNINMSGGVSRHSGDTFFISRNEGTISLNIFKTASDKSSYSDFNRAIPVTIVTSWDAVGNSAQFKKFIRLKVFSTDSNQKFEGDSFKMNLYLRSNFDNKDIGPIVLDPSAFGGWGISPWGSFYWGSRDFQGIRTKLFGKSKAIALHFDNDTINENILISGYSMEIASPYKPEIKE